MLQAVFDKETAGIIVRGEFFDLDKIYFMNERLAGNYGVDNTCLLDGYGEAAAVLKSLNYEIRHAEHGDRDLYVAYNGIHEDWFAPVGTPAVRILKEEDQNDPDEIINEIEDGVMTDLDIDLDEFYEMDEDDQREALGELYLDEEGMEMFFSWLHKEQTWPFRTEDYPDAGEKNTYLQFRIPFAEGLLYALVLRDILSQKEEFIKKSLEQAKENKNGLGDYELNFCRNRMPSELLLTELLMTELFSCVYLAIGDDKGQYELFREKLIPVGTFRGMTAEGVKKAAHAAAGCTGTDINSVIRLMEDLRAC